MQGRFQEWRDHHPDCASQCTMAAIVLLFLGLWYGLVVFFNLEASVMPHYSVAINSAAGLDGLGRPTLDPKFNLTLGVASRGFMGMQCIDEDEITVEVSYRGVQLARSEPAKKLCAEARSHEEELGVAFGVDVHVPRCRGS